MQSLDLDQAGAQPHSGLYLDFLSDAGRRSAAVPEVRGDENVVVVHGCTQATTVHASNKAHAARAIQGARTDGGRDRPGWPGSAQGPSCESRHPGLGFAMFRTASDHGGDWRFCEGVRPSGCSALRSVMTAAMVANRPQRNVYDSRVRELIRATGNPDLFPELKIPRYTSAGWLHGKFRMALTETVA
jgi:hypothetical protein